MQSNQQQNNPTTELEKSYLQTAYKTVIGIDEAGRGPWAGPIAFAAYKYDLSDKIVPFVKDSKLLSPNKREEIFSNFPISRYKYVLINNELIDQEGMAQAIKIGIKQLVAMFNPQGSIFLIDGNYKLDLDIAYKSIIKGDRLHYSIACASIVAKVTRDKLMKEYAKQFPQYNFENNKGYGTAAHLRSLIEYGPCKLHRVSFKPIKEIIKKKS